MILLNCSVWLGPGRNMTDEQVLKFPATIKSSSFASNLPIGETLNRLKNYQDAYNAKYSIAINITLLGVSKVSGDILTDTLEALNVEFVSNLPQCLEDFNNL